jgi:hypothetical protein
MTPHWQRRSLAWLRRGTRLSRRRRGRMPATLLGKQSKAGRSVRAEQLAAVQWRRALALAPAAQALPQPVSAALLRLAQVSLLPASPSRLRPPPRRLPQQLRSVCGPCLPAPRRA